MLFGGPFKLFNFRLTAREVADMKYREKVFHYAKQHEQAVDIIKVKRYHVPDAKVKSIPTEYIEEDVEEVSKGDGRRWEDERLAAALASYGAKDAEKVIAFTLILFF